MFAKRLFQKATHHHRRHHQHHGKSSLLTSDDVNLRVNVHYGVPCTASILAFDPIQRLLAIGTLDGRIKVIGDDNIEGLLISPKLLPYKYLEFLQNQGFLISITNDNDIQVWNLETRSIACSLQWEYHVTAFSVISGSSFMYVGDEYGMMWVLKYDPDHVQLLQLPYQLSSDSLTGAAGLSNSERQLVVGVLPQSGASGNRLLIAYQGGLIVLWDFVEAQVVAVRGDKVLQLKNEVGPPDDVDVNIVDDATSDNLKRKEISALCWASTDGSVLAVGYIDGDILFWNTSKTSSLKGKQTPSPKNVVKLRLSSAEKRLPVIVLHWLDNNKSRNHGGQLLVYGGDEIGCEEVVTVLSLEWSSGMEELKCIGCADLTLTGSFADMILVPSAGTTSSGKDASLFVLSNPGHVQIYDTGNLSFSESQLRAELSVHAVNFPACIPTVDPLMTVAVLFHVNGSREGFQVTGMSSTVTLPGNKKWPLTGGVSNHFLYGKDNQFHRLYVAGYEDGSIQIWDATYPVFLLLHVLKNEGKTENMVDSSASVTIVDLCSSTLRLAAGSQCGLVRIYNLCTSDETNFHFVTETEREVRISAQVQGPRCQAAFNLHKSGIHALKFTNNGSKLLVGYECSRIAMLDVHSSSVAFITDSMPSPNSPVISIFSGAFVYDTTKNKNESAPKIPDDRDFIFILTKDANIYVIDGNDGNMISSRPVHLKKQSSAISMYLIESHAENSRSVKQQRPEDDSSVNEISHNASTQGSETCETQDHASDRKPSAKSLKELLVLLCCKDSLRVYPAKYVFQGENKSIYKVNLSKACCWTSIIRKDDKVCGLVVFYQTGTMEIRTLPDLQLVKELSLMSELRWNFKANMERMMSSTDNGQITLANGSEVAFISVLEGENAFRIPESLPNLHDEVLAAAANAAISASSDARRKKVLTISLLASQCLYFTCSTVSCNCLTMVLRGGNPGIFGGIVKGFTERKSDQSHYLNSNSISDFSHLDDIFMRNAFPEPSTTTYDAEETAELTIDYFEIDDRVPSTSTSVQDVDNKDKDQKNDREKLFGYGADTKPRLRTREEIIAKYRKAGYASSAAGEARNKPLERRQQKLERVSRQTEDLRNGAEEFASLANELAKAMENRKWYHI